MMNRLDSVAIVPYLQAVDLVPDDCVKAVVTMPADGVVQVTYTVSITHERLDAFLHAITSYMDAQRATERDPQQ